MQGSGGRTTQSASFFAKYRRWKVIGFGMRAVTNKQKKTKKDKKKESEIETVTFISA